MLTLALISCCAMPLFQMTEADVDTRLADLCARHCDYGGRVASLAQLALDTPYAADPLGEGPGAPYDADPLMDLAKADCVTFVEQILALAASRTYQEAFDTLQKIRYRDGKIAFENRNHFMIADWVANNKFCRDVTANLQAPTEKVTRTVGRRHFYTLKEIESLAAAAVDPEMTLEYVPVAGVAAAEPNLPSPALILLIGKVDWLFTLHCGLYVRGENGQGLFYNASSKREKAVAVPLSEVFENTTRYIGFTACAITSP